MVGVNLKALLVTLGASLLIATLPGRGLASEDSVRIRHTRVADFPQMEVTVSVEGTENYDANDLVVEQNGEPVEGVDIQPLTSTGEGIEVVLVIDTSGSMEGEPMDSAIDAAESFVEQLPQFVRVGVVAFSDDPSAVVRITSNHSKVLGRIENLTASGETALYNGVLTAAQMFRGDAQRNIVLLSDGGDTASHVGLNDAATAAKKVGAAVFSVGLETAETDVQALRTMSALSGGRYEPAATADLSQVYEGLADELSSQYAISYESTASPGDEFEIRVTAPTGSDEVTVLAPGAPAGATGPPTARPEPETAGRPAGWMPNVVVKAGGRVAARAGLAAKIEHRLEQGAIALKAGEFAGMSLLAAVAAYVVGGLVVGNLFLAVMLAVLAGVAPNVWLGGKISGRAKKLNEQLPDILSVLASSLRAGNSFLQSLDMVAQEIDDPGATEFQRVVAEIRLGRSVDDAMNAMAERIGSEAFTWATLAVNIQREVGGNLAEVLDTVASTLRTREALRRQVKTLSAEGRLSMYILAALPPGLALYLAVVNPTYLGLLFSTQIGMIMVASGLCLLAAGFLWMRKVVAIDV
jgi:tight adherence protein B